jgi:hypothetical protein
MADRLKLRARDAADMDVIAALLQDALVPVADLAYLRRERRFVLVVNRFMWERAPDEREAPAAGRMPDPRDDDARFEDAGAGARYWRTHTGLTFERVKAAASRNLPRGRDAILNLLTVSSEARRIVFHFSGGAQLRLEVGEIRCHMEDLGEPWPTAARPAHEASA